MTEEDIKNIIKDSKDGVTYFKSLYLAEKVHFLSTAFARIINSNSTKECSDALTHTITICLTWLLSIEE